MISGDTTVARLLEEHPALLDVLIEYHPHFKHLRNRLLRRVVAPRVTVSQAARIAGIPVTELLGALRRTAGQGAGTDAATERPAGPPAPAPKPAFLDALPESNRVCVDVRDDIRRGEEPFARIMAAVKGLREGDALVLRAPFEPIPLCDVLGKRGFSHWTDCHGAADWSVWFYREASGAARASETIAIDVRGLEPPQPMVRVLELLDTLVAGQRLEVIHDRRPLFLYPQLDAQGFVHETEELKPGLVRIVIARGS